MTLDTLATLLIEVNVPGLVEKYRAGMAQLGYPLSCAVYRGDIRLYASDPEVGALDTGEDGYSVMRLDGQESLCVSYTSPQGLKYVALVDYSAINKDVSAASRYMAGIIVITLILVLAFSGAMMSGILRWATRRCWRSSTPLPSAAIPFPRTTIPTTAGRMRSASCTVTSTR